MARQLTVSTVRNRLRTASKQELDCCTTSAERKAVLDACYETRYSVTLTVYEQEMYYTITHAAMFKTARGAERLLAEVQESMKAHFSWSNEFAGIVITRWTWSPSRSNPWQFMQDAPTAVPYTVER